MVAILNIQLPLILGQLVNTVSALQPGQQMQDYFSILVPPGLRLAGIYSLQSLFTFGYIALLSVVGERCAMRVRTQLFQRLLEKDIVFFDTHRTGELINR